MAGIIQEISCYSRSLAYSLASPQVDNACDSWPLSYADGVDWS
jgi:hypothetical protein